MNKLIHFLSKFRITRKIIFLFHRFIPLDAIWITQLNLSKTEILVPAHDFIGFRLFALGGFEEHIQKVARELDIQSKEIIDAGCNIGAFTFNTHDLASRVIAIDASPVCCDFIEKNIEKLSLSNIAVVNKAITDKDNQTIELRLSENTYGNNSICYKGDPSSKQIDVQTITIDSLVKKYEINPYLIKVDVEGAEPLLIRGAQQTIKQFEPILIIEWNGFINKDLSISTGDYIILTNNNYQFYEIRATAKLVKLTKNDIQKLNNNPQCLDILCLPNSKTHLVRDKTSFPQQSI